MNPFGEHEDEELGMYGNADAQQGHGPRRQEKSAIHTTTTTTAADMPSATDPRTVARRYKYLTDVTWSEVGNRITPQIAIGWEKESDLAYLAVGRDARLSQHQIMTLISAVRSRLPVVMTWDTPWQVDHVARTTRTVVVTRFSPPAVPATPSLPGRMRIAYWGFEHDVFLSAVVHVETPPVTTDYIDTADSKATGHAH